MKIGVLIDRLNVGGVEKIAIEEVRALRLLGVDAELVVLCRKAVIEGAFADIMIGMPVTYLDDRLPSWLRFSARVPFFYFFSIFHLTYPILLPWTVQKNEYDFIISHNTYTSFTAFTLFKFRAIPYAIYVWDPIAYIVVKAYPKGAIHKLRFILSPLSRFLDRGLVGKARSVIVAGSLHYQYLSQFGNNKNIILLPPGHDTSPSIPLRRGAYVFAATAWKEGKGLEKLIKMCAEIGHCKLKIAGKWLHQNYRSKIEDLICELKIVDRVELMDDVNEDKLNELYLAARVVVIINNERGFGLTALEGAANGCTFIIPDECGACMYFTDKVDGFFYKYGDNAHCKELIQQLVSDHDLAYQLGRNAWEKVGRNYSWEQHAKTLIKLTRECH